jgi:hypothetical protein
VGPPGGEYQIRPRDHANGQLACGAGRRIQFAGRQYLEGCALGGLADGGLHARALHGGRLAWLEPVQQCASHYLGHRRAAQVRGADEDDYEWERGPRRRVRAEDCRTSTGNLPSGGQYITRVPQVTPWRAETSGAVGAIRE